MARLSSAHSSDMDMKRCECGRKFIQSQTRTAPRIFRDRKIDIGKHIDIEVDQKALIVSGPRQGFSRSAGRIGLALLHTECVYRFGFAGRDVVDGEEEDAPGSQQWTPWPEIDEMSCCAEKTDARLLALRQRFQVQSRNPAEHDRRSTTGQAFVNLVRNCHRHTANGIDIHRFFDVALGQADAYRICKRDISSAWFKGKLDHPSRNHTI